MADDHTRVFDYNGRKFVSILGRETFPGERVFKLPTRAVELASRQPLTSALLPCRVGYHPRAAGQKVSRPSGDWAFTLLFCIEGRGRLKLARSSHELRRGTFVLLRPFEFHAYEADVAEPWSYYWIHFNGALAQQYYELLTGGGKKTCVQIAPDISFVRGFEKILALFHEGCAHKVMVQASCALHQLLGDLYALVCQCGGHPESPRERIERTLAVVRADLSMQVSIQELAALANMSQAHYTLHFRQLVRESPRSYINKLKMARAGELLRASGAKVDVVASQLGYDDPFYFCRLFKKVMGTTPTRYRRQEGTPPTGAA